MPLETASTIADLVSTNPVGASDTPASLDDHIRLIKTVLKADALVDADIGVNVASYSHTHSGAYAPVGAVTSSGLTQSTSKLLGRTTASTGAIEEISAGSSLSLSGGSINANIASQAEAEAGTDTAKMMTPQRVSQAITALSSGFGVGQTWQTFTVGVQRIAGTTYTNSTGKPIMVCITGSNSTTNYSITVGGVVIGQMPVNGAGVVGTFSFVVPDSTNYVLQTGANVSSWAELR